MVVYDEDSSGWSGLCRVVLWFEERVKMSSVNVRLSLDPCLMKLMGDV